MPLNINLLDNNLGIAEITTNQNADKLPTARNLASNIAHDLGLDRLYPNNSIEQQLATMLRPATGDGSIIQPENFRAALGKCLENLKETNDPAVQKFVQKELQPLLENTALLNAYTGLMIGG